MGPGLRYKEPERGREVSPTIYPIELIRIYKDYNKKEIWIKQDLDHTFVNARKVYCNQLFYENLKRPLHFDIFVLTPLYGVRFILEFNRQIWHKHLCQFVTNLLLFWKFQSNTTFLKNTLLLCSLMKYFIVLSRIYCEGDSAFFSPRGLSTCFLENTKRLFCFASAANLPRGKATLSLFWKLAKRAS